MDSLKLQHCAYKITPDKKEFIKRLFIELGFEPVHEAELTVLMKPKDNDFKLFTIQFIVSDDESKSIDVKVNSHIAFISKTPKEDLNKIKEWIENKGFLTREGSWSDKELWLDCPDIFIDFVIEIMHTSVLEGD
jgi:hypothetical protein